MMNPSDLLERGFRELGIHCSSSQMESFLTYLSELKKWNRAYNLTALKSDRDIIIKHFLDSLLYLPMILNRQLYQFVRLFLRLC